MSANNSEKDELSSGLSRQAKISVYVLPTEKGKQVEEQHCIIQFVTDDDKTKFVDVVREILDRKS